MDLPVYENETPVGTLRVARQGLYTVFTAELPSAALDAALTRLWLLDASGAAAPLGLLEPTGEGRRLRRRLSRLELQRLPPEPRTALILPADGKPRRGGLWPPAVPKDIPEGIERESGRPQLAPTGSAAPASTSSRSASRVPHSASPWRRLSDGSLVDPAGRLLALPWAGGEPPAPARTLSVDGREYMVFRY